MRKRIHGKQSVPANIFLFPRKGSEVTDAFSGRTATRKPRSAVSPDSQILEHPSHSRTLYTSRPMDQSNFIRNGKEPACTASGPAAASTKTTFRLQDWR